MSKARENEQPAIQLEGDEDRFVHAVWSRSFRRVILTVGSQNWHGPIRQVELRADQAAELAEFLGQPRRRVK